MRATQVTAADLVFVPERRGANYRHIEMPINVAPFDDSAVIKHYAEKFQESECDNYTLDEYAEVVSGLLKDDSAGRRFKGLVRKMRRNRCSHIA